MSESALCPALLVSAPASGQGKTLVTAALARHHRSAGRRVRVFKCGPDFLDPMILERASGAPVYQLDLFMVGLEECRRRLYEAACEADVILVEGVMGLYDGDPSAADLAAAFGLAILAVIDGAAMAQTFGAVALGLAGYREDIDLVAVLANRVGSEGHARMLAESLPPGIAWLGALPRDPDAAFPERHLGLVQADEIADFEARLERAAAHLPAAADWLPAPVAFTQPDAVRIEPARGLLEGLRVAIARDDAFGFIYPANLDWLREMGAQVSFFSPLGDTAVPTCDAIWLPGGYPELHLEALASNRAMIAELQGHHLAGTPILAECGGMLYCLEELRAGDGTSAALAGLLPGRAAMQPRLAGLGLQEVAFAEGTLRGHTFHYSHMETSLEPVAQATGTRGRPGEAIFRHGSLTASYMHLYFSSCPQVSARLFRPLGVSAPHVPVGAPAGA